MIEEKNFKEFNKATKKNYKFKKFYDNLFFAKIDNNKLGDFDSIVDSAGIYAYTKTPYEITALPDSLKNKLNKDDFNR